MLESCLDPPAPLERVGDSLQEVDGWNLDGERLAALSHELRSPLATIALALEAAATTSSVEDWQEALQIADRQTRKAIQLIDDLFEWSASRQGKIRLRMEAVDLGLIARLAVESTTHLIAARDQSLSVSIPAEGVLAIGDALRLEQIISNLLANAAKFTDPGGRIRLSVGAERDEVFVSVQDDGCGIDPTRIPSLFEPFVQLGDGCEARVAGLGIGLAIVRTLVELHGGQVFATSDGPGQGATFTVKLSAPEVVDETI